MTESDRRMLRKIAGEDGPVQILVYRSVSDDADGAVRFVAQCLRYGGILASGLDEDTALGRAVDQVISYLRRCAIARVSSTDRKSWASKEVLAAFSMARRKTLPETLASYFTAASDPDFRDPELIDVRQIDASEQPASIEEYVDAQCGAAVA